MVWAVVLGRFWFGSCGVGGAERLSGNMVGETRHRHVLKCVDRKDLLNSRTRTEGVRVVGGEGRAPTEGGGSVITGSRVNVGLTLLLVGHRSVISAVVPNSYIKQTALP